MEWCFKTLAEDKILLKSITKRGLPDLIGLKTTERIAGYEIEVR